MELKSTSFKLTPKRLANLKVIAASWGCMYNGAPSVGELLNMIADSKVSIMLPDSAQSNMGDVTKKVNVFDSRQLSLVEPKGPVYEEVPCVTRSPYVTARDDGSFVDTEEFDKPVPRRVGNAPVGIDAPVIAPVPCVPSNASKADKLDLLSKLGFKAGVKL